MADPQLDEFVRWAMNNGKNKKKAIQAACSIISILSQYDKKDLSEEEMKKIIGGIHIECKDDPDIDVE